MQDETAKPARRARGGLIVQGLVALAGTSAALWWSFRGVDFSDVGRQFQSVPLATVLIVLGSQLFLHLVRSLRWGILVKPLGNATPRQILTASSIGFAGTFFLPLRLGELVRPALISRAGVPFVGAMASVVVERMFDGLMGVGLLFVMLSILPSSTQISAELQTVGFVALGVFGGGLVALALTVAAKKPAFMVIRATAGRLSPGFAERIINLLSSFIDGLNVLRNPRRLAGFVALTGLFWVISCVALWLLPNALQPGIPMSVGPFIISVTTFTVMIPAGPGFAGTLEAGFVLAMGPFGTTRVDAVTIALAFHAIQVASMALVGGFGLLIAQNRNLRADATAPVE